MIQTFQRIVNGNTALEIDTTKSDEVTLSISFMTDPPEEITLDTEQVERLVQQLGAWLGEKKL